MQKFRLTITSLYVGEDGELPRVKPFKYTYQKEIVMYAYFKKLDYFSTECIYAPFAARGLARDFVKDLEVSIHCLFAFSPDTCMEPNLCNSFVLEVVHAAFATRELLAFEGSSLNLHAHSCHLGAILPFDSACAWVASSWVNPAALHIAKVQQVNCPIFTHIVCCATWY